MDVIAPGTGAPDANEAEVQSLRRSMNDVSSVLALPRMWSDSDVGEMVRKLAEALRGVLSLDLVYISLDATNVVPADEVAVVSRDWDLASEASLIGAQLRAQLGTHRRQWPPKARGQLSSKELAFAGAPLGISRELGVIVAAAEQGTFPSAQEQLLLNVSASQVTLA